MGEISTGLNCVSLSITSFCLCFYLFFSSFSFFLLCFPSFQLFILSLSALLFISFFLSFSFLSVFLGSSHSSSVFVKLAYLTVVFSSPFLIFPLEFSKLGYINRLSEFWNCIQQTKINCFISKYCLSSIRFCFSILFYLCCFVSFLFFFTFSKFPSSKYVDKSFLKK